MLGAGMLSASMLRAGILKAGMRSAVRRGRLTAASLLALALTATFSVMAGGPARADTVRDAQLWVLNAISAPTAWSVTEGRGATVAVIDSGVNPGVSDLTGSVISGPDLTGLHTPPSNPNWGEHGTWMASLIAGHGHAGGGSGIMGVAPQSKILSIRVVTDRRDPGYAAYEHESDARVQTALAGAIHYAISRGVGVISMSLGYGQPSAEVRSALQDAFSRGIVVVASSGNSGDSVGARATGQAPYSFPADYPGVLGVAAVSRGASSAGFSSNNLSVQVAAPGVNVPAQGTDGQYWLVSGTSPACALTAGVAALIKARYPRLAAALVVRAITDSTQHRPPRGYDNKVGFGTVDAAAALTAAATLARPGQGLVGTAMTVHFGGGAAAAPPVPVPPRRPTGLVVASLFALVFLAAAAVTGTRLIALRRARSRGHHAVAARAPQPVWPGPQVHATWPGTGERGWDDERAVGSADQAAGWTSWPGAGS
jgi:subtilisin family serine protease